MNSHQGGCFHNYWEPHLRMASPCLPFLEPGLPYGTMSHCSQKPEKCWVKTQPWAKSIWDMQHRKCVVCPFLLHTVKFWEGMQFFKNLFVFIQCFPNKTGAKPFIWATFTTRWEHFQKCCSETAVSNFWGSGPLYTHKKLSTSKSFVLIII